MGGSVWNSIKKNTKIVKENYEVVINLSDDKSIGIIENEDEIITKLKMTYIHIPVDFKEPTVKNLKDFIDILSFLSSKKVWIHCVKNYRVSAFMYVYHKYILNTPFENINVELFKEWSPNETWQKIMKTPIEEIR